MGIENWIAYVVATLILSIIPGPSVLLVVGQALANGRRAAFACIAGDILGGACLILLSLLGIGALLATSATLFAIVKWIGVLYLAYLGFCQFIEAKKLFSSDEYNQERFVSLRGCFSAGLLTELLNPKSIAFHMAFLVQFIDPATNLPLQYVVLILTNAIIAALVLAGFAIVASKAKRTLKSKKAQQTVKYASGSFYIGGSAIMAATR